MNAAIALHMRTNRLAIIWARNGSSIDIPITMAGKTKTQGISNPFKRAAICRPPSSCIV